MAAGGITRYVVVGRFLRLNAGRVQLTPQQAKDRAYGLAPVDVKKGLYEVTKQVEFKRGEEVGVDGGLNKLSRQVAIPKAEIESAAKKAVEPEAATPDVTAVPDEAPDTDADDEQAAPKRSKRGGRLNAGVVDPTANG